MPNRVGHRHRIVPADLHEQVAARPALLESVDPERGQCAEPRGPIGPDPREREHPRSEPKRDGQSRRVDSEFGIEVAAWADAVAVLDRAIADHPRSSLLPQLVFTRISALYEQPQRRKETAALYSDFASTYPDHELTPRAVYMAALAAVRSDPAVQYVERDTRIRGGLTATGLSLDLLVMDVPPELAARVRDIQEMLERMETGRFKVFDHLEEWFGEFRQYHRMDGLIVKEYDDLISASRYAMMMLRHARIARSARNPFGFDDRGGPGHVRAPLSPVQRLRLISRRRQCGGSGAGTAYSTR